MIKTPNEYAMTVAQNLRKLRKRKKLSMEALAHKSGVSYGSLKRFERTGQISFMSLIKIAVVLDCAEPLEALFQTVEITSIQEIIDGKV